MRIHRFISEGFEGAVGDEWVIQDQQLVHQLRSVLRYAPGDELELLDGDGVVARVRIVEVSRSFVSVNVVRAESVKELTPSVTVGFGVIKHVERTSYLIQKCTELGVVEFQPLITQRCVVQRLPKPTRLRRVCDEAVEQSMRVVRPSIRDAVQFSDIISDVSGDSWVGFGSVGGDALSVRSCFEELQVGDRSRVVLVGPEGGFTEAEEASLRDAGGVPISLGEHVLRTETAASMLAGLGIWL